MVYISFEKTNDFIPSINSFLFSKYKFDWRPGKNNNNRFLTNFHSPWSVAIIESQVRHLAVVCVYVKIRNAHNDCVSSGHADLPFTHAVWGIGQRVPQRRQASTAHTQHCVSTAVPWKTSRNYQALCRAQILRYFDIYIMHQDVKKILLQGNII